MRPALPIRALTRPLLCLLAALMLSACHTAPVPDPERQVEIAPDYDERGVREIVILEPVVPEALDDVFRPALKRALRHFALNARFYSQPAEKWVDYQLQVAPTPPEQANSLLQVDGCLVVTIEGIDERALPTRGKLYVTGRAELFQNGETLFRHRFENAVLLADAPLDTPLGRDDALRRLAKAGARLFLEPLPPKAFR